MSHNESQEERLIKLETQISFYEAIATEQRSDIKEIKDTANLINTSIAVFHTKCLQCQSKPDLEPRVRELEKRVDLFSGGLKFSEKLMVFGAAGLSAVSLVLAWLKGK
jgi:uncharacterized coiled-coil protein SlyX